MLTFAGIVDLWPTAVELARDLGLPPVKGPLRTRAWRNRDFIPPGMWPDVIAAAERRGFAGVTAERLAALAKVRKAA